MQDALSEVVDQIGRILLGKEAQIRLAVTCLLAQGHLLIEDLPGMGKTTLAHCLARVMGLRYDRVQFTSDLLPSDILGVSIFDRNKTVFEFRPGPIFTQVLLADEINRSPPKTQSALLEAMEEGQVTVDGLSRELPIPFFVIATQNPQYQSGTYALPESQLDRFLMRLTLGYPNAQAEIRLFKGADSRAALNDLKPVVDAETLLEWQKMVNTIHVSDSLAHYLQRLVEHSRFSEGFDMGLSPRGALAWLRASKAWALIHRRDYVVPEDLQATAHAVVAHRLVGKDAQTILVDRLLEAVDVVV